MEPSNRRAFMRGLASLLLLAGGVAAMSISADGDGDCRYRLPRISHPPLAPPANASRERRVEGVLAWVRSS